MINECDCSHLDSAKVCLLPPPCKISIERMLTRYVLRFQHGDNEEHSIEVDFIEVKELPIEVRHKVLNWVDSVHEYEKLNKDGDL